MSKIAIVPAGFLLAVMQLAAASGGGPLGALFGAFVLGLGVIAVVQLFGVPSAEPWLLPLLAACASAGGVVMMSSLPVGVLVGSPAVAGLTAWLVALLKDRGSVRCEQNGCGKAVPDEGGLMKCPRCSLNTCAECWIPEYARCQKCEANGVPILPADPGWWSRNFEYVERLGKCASCLEHGKDLPKCMKCGTPQCRECWDANNAQCVMPDCGWAPPGMPRALARYVRRRGGSGREQRTRRQ